MPSKKKKTKKLTAQLSECRISTPKPEVKKIESPGASLVFDENIDPEVSEKWPLPCPKVPDIFLHKPADFARHARKLLSNDINFCHPLLYEYYTKITCPSFTDHKAMVKYFDSMCLPYHTFGHPSKRKMKVVIRGLANGVDLNELKTELKGGSIPVVRIHRMQRRQNVKDVKPLILVVVPNDDEGRKLLFIKKIFGSDVTLEPPKSKTKQCYRCQKWGHAQRYCHGEIKCVKCAGDHLSKKCDRDPEDPVKCANCGHEGHVASWRDCPYCPDSTMPKQTQARKKATRIQTCSLPVLVTLKTCNTLYKNVRYD